MHAAANWLQPRLIWWLATASASHGMIHNIAFQPIPYPGGRFEPKNRSRGPAWKAYRFWGLSRNLTKKNPRDTCDAKGGLGHLAPKIAVESLSSISSIQHISWIFMILQHVVVTWLGPNQFLAEPVLSCKLPSWHEFSDFLADPADTLRHDSLVVAAMGSDSSHGVHHCPQKSRLETPWLSCWARWHRDIATSLNPCHGFSHGGVGVRHEIPRHRALAGWPAAPGMEDGWWQKPGAAAATPGRTGGGGQEDEGSTEGGHAGIGDAGRHCALWCVASSKEACGNQGGGGERVDLRKILLGSVMIGSQSGLVPVHPVPYGSFILVKTNLKKTTRKRW